LLHGARRMQAWSGDPALVEDSRLQRFYARTVSEFVAAHDPNGNGIAEGASGNGWGIACTYNELPGVVLAESADSLGTQCRAFAAQAHFLRARGDAVGAQWWASKAAELRRRFNEAWYDADAGRYLIGFDHPGYRPVNAFGYETSWFIPYTALCDPGPRAAAYLDFIHEHFQARPSRNLEAWTYLPDVFYAWGQDDRGWNYFQHVLDHRSDYPEVSFTVISQLATRIMGIEPDAPNRALSTLGHLPQEVEWLELDHVPLGPGELRVRHEQGNRSTTVENHAGSDVVWQARFRGRHANIAVDGVASPARPETVRGLEVSSVTLTVKPGQQRTATVSQASEG